MEPKVGMIGAQLPPAQGCLLHPVLAKDTLAGGEDGRDLPPRLLLGHGHQGHLVDAPRRLCRVVDASANVFQGGSHRTAA